jgi:hypothetical protein
MWVNMRVLCLRHHDSLPLWAVLRRCARRASAIGGDVLPGPMPGALDLLATLDVPVRYLRGNGGARRWLRWMATS